MSELENDGPWNLCLRQRREIGEIGAIGGQLRDALRHSAGEDGLIDPFMRLCRWCICAIGLGNSDQRKGFEGGDRQSWHHIGQTRPLDGEAETRAPAQPTHRGRHHRGSPLEMGQHEVAPLLL